MAQGRFSRRFSRRQVLKAGAAVVGSQLPALGHAAAFDVDKPIRIIVPFPPGNTIDLLTRAIQPGLSREIGRPVVVENLTGAAGRIGMNAIARAAPDGYTVGAVQGGVVIIQPFTMKDLPYDVLTDFRAVSCSAWNYNVVVSAKSAPFATIQELVTWAKANPGKLTVGTNGEGGYPHVWFHDFSQRAGFKYTMVPFRGSTEIGTALAGDHIMVGADSMPGQRTLITSNQVRVLATTNGARAKEVPDTPTLNELYPGLVRNGWFGFMVPAKTSTEAVNRLNAAINKTITEPKVQELLASYPLISVAESADYFTKLVREDYDRFGAIIKQMGLKPQ
jgi:tripartite-type tricarboxylate transporter receptor subunit TctC